ncbi:uncharacterized protein [Magallana gigas]|uniref:uncharacterized protein n=1 Tax=Magallana gigas TaxID=29159 RepID=UPI00333F085F
MAVSTRVYVAVLFVMIHVYVGHRGVLGQLSECVTKSASCASSLKIIDDKEELCRSVSEYLTCVKNALKDCGSNAEDTLKKAEEQMAQHECSSAGVPVISVLCLLMAAIVLVL